MTYTESNSTAIYTLTNNNNCDSVITLDLTINSSSEIDIFYNQYEIHTYPNPFTNQTTVSFYNTVM